MPDRHSLTALNAGIYASVCQDKQTRVPRRRLWNALDLLIRPAHRSGDDADLKLPGPACCIPSVREGWRLVSTGTREARRPDPSREPSVDQADQGDG